MAAATLTLAPTQASAAPPRCNAPAGESCIQITNVNTPIRSARESKTNRCLTGIVRGQTSYWPNVWTYYWRDHMMLRTFTGANCEGNTEYTPKLNFVWKGPNGNGYDYTSLRDF